VFRNRATLEVLHERLVRALEPATDELEMVFVDDACPEESDEALAALARRDARVRVVTHPTNRGQQRAVLSGLAAATGDHLVVMDADLQDPPEAVPGLLRVLREGRHAGVFAGRRGAYESPARLTASALFKGVLARLAGVPRDAGLFVAMDRRLVDALLAMRWRRPFVVAMVGCTGMKVGSVPVRREPRPSGRSAYTSAARLRLGLLALAATLEHRLRRSWLGESRT
jgi:glycosyltransferase involved in cell wall biosynthesis